MTDKRLTAYGRRRSSSIAHFVIFFDWGFLSTKNNPDTFIALDSIIIDELSLDICCSRQSSCSGFPH
jgi:hypothetical protein